MADMTKAEALAKLWEMDAPMRMARYALPHHGLLAGLANGVAIPAPGQEQEPPWWPVLLTAGLIETVDAMIQLTPEGKGYVNDSIDPEFRRYLAEKV